MKNHKDIDDVLLQYRCLDCGKHTTEYRRLHYKGEYTSMRGGKIKYDTHKCPFCRGRLQKVAPINMHKEGTNDG